MFFGIEHGRISSFTFNNVGYWDNWVRYCLHDECFAVDLVLVCFIAPTVMLILINTNYNAYIFVTIPKTVVIPSYPHSE